MGEPIQVGGPQGDGRRRVLLLAGGAALVILAVLVLPGLLFGGGSTPEDPTSFPVPEQGSQPTVPVEDAVPETVEAFTDKNPFEPLVAVDAPSGEAGGDTGEEPAGDEPVPPFPTGETSGDEEPIPGEEEPVPGEQPTGEPGETTSTTAQAPPPRQPDRVAMLEVFTDPGGQVVATIRVNDVVHQVAEGDEFATSYRVLSLDLESRCGQLLFGDERFGLCEGDETLK